MPARSKSQQRLFGIVHAIQKGDLKAERFPKRIRDMARRVDPGDAADFASTKSKGLPEKKAASASADPMFVRGFLSGLREAFPSLRIPPRASE